MRPLPALILTLALSTSPFLHGCGRHNGAGVLGFGLATTFVVAPIVAEAAREPPSEPSPDGPNIDLGPFVVGAPIAISGLLITVAGLIGWVRANADSPTEASRPPPIVEAPADPLTRTLERAVIRARAGNCGAALRLTDEIFDQDEFFYRANVPQEPTLAACLAARG